MPRPAANRDDRFSPHGVYRCAGADFWVAVCCQDDGAWPALAATIGRDDLAGDAALATLAGRRARTAEIDAAVSAWAADWEQEEAAACLQAAGVSAAPVLANWQMLADPHLHERGVFPAIVHPVVGVHRTTALPIRFARTPARYRRPAPLFARAQPGGAVGGGPQRRRDRRPVRGGCDGRRAGGVSVAASPGHARVTRTGPAASP